MAKDMKSRSSKSMVSRLKQAVGPGASMVPQEKVPAPPPKKEEEVVPDLHELIDNRSERRTFTALVKQYLEFSDDVKIAQAGKDRLSKSMKEVVGSYGISKVLVDGILVNYFNAPRSTIKSDLLLAAGISPATIASCTEVKDVYTLRVTPPKE